MKLNTQSPLVVLCLFFSIITIFSCSKDSDLLTDYVALDPDIGTIARFVANDTYQISISNNEEDETFDIIVNSGSTGTDNGESSGTTVNDSYQTSTTASIVLDVLANDTFEKKEEVLISETSQPAYGDVVINADNTITYTPTVVEATEDTFTYTAEFVEEDGKISAETGTVTVNINQDIINMGVLKAFPGAEGFGKNATGGRGGTVIHVTNLNDSGSGSFRDALATKGTRTIVFDVSGTINAENYFDIPFDNGNVTIAGQTAPGDGILIKGGELRISASNVIVRYIRFRVGVSTLGAASNEDGINISAYNGNAIENIIIDHCSISWAQDENISIVGGFSGSTVSNVTVQNSIISESGYGFLIYKNNTNISVLRNLFIHNRERNIRANWPISGVLQFEQINNLIYGYRGGNSPSLGTKFTTVNNKFKKAPSTDLGGNASINGEPDGTGIVGDTYAYIYGNIVGSGQTEYSSNLSPYIETTPFATSGYTPILTSNLESTLLDNVGASLPTRDAVDARLIDEYINNNGSLSSSGTYPTISSGSTYTDNDMDGMSDSWETDNELNPNDASDRNNDRNNDGYTSLEEFLYYLTTK